MASNDNGGNFITGFFLGGIIGTIVGIMLAPKPGTETRSELLDQSDTLRRRAEELAARAREQIGPAIDEFRERVRPVVERVTTNSEASTVSSKGHQGSRSEERLGGSDGSEPRE